MKLEVTSNSGPLPQTFNTVAPHTTQAFAPKARRPDKNHGLKSIFACISTVYLIYANVINRSI